MSDRIECQSCSAPTELFICARCVAELRDQLRSLARGPEVNGHNTAGLLDALADVELKRTKLGNGGGHRKKGDEMPIPFLPDNGRMDKDERPVPSPQGWAALLLVSARNSLSTMVRDICESRGVDVMRAFRVVPHGFVGPLMLGWSRAPRQWDPSTAEMAAWLANHVHALACDESAGQWRAEVDSLVRQIKRAIDRPVRIELLGLCTTQVDGTKTCDTALRAPEDAIEVRCRKCHTVRRCDQVRRIAQSDARKEPITWKQVLEVNKRQPDDWRVHERTLRDWRKTGVLSPRGFLRTEGGYGLHRRSDDDEPLYKWDDIEHLRVHGVPRGARKRTRAGR